MSEPSAVPAEAVRDLAEELLGFVRVPSVSSDPERRDDCRGAAAWLRDRFEAAGAAVARLIETPLHPAVFASFPPPPGSPTILVYGHYDVQPAEASAWTSPPFEPEIRNGRVYGRGSSDDKGNVLAALAAVRSLKAGPDGLGIGLKFLIEGEEEIGSPHLDALLAEHRRLLACDAAFCADGGMFGESSCSIGVSARGGFVLRLWVKGPASDTHSGLVGGAVRNPIHELSALIASLHDGEGMVAVEGFYDRVRPLEAEERLELARLPFDEELFVAANGPLHGEREYSVPERIGARPALDLIAFHGGGGAGGEGVTAIVPSKAWAVLMCRTVADQDPWVVREQVKQHLKKLMPEGLSYGFEEKDCFWDYRVPEGLPALSSAIRALEEVYGTRPLLCRDGGGLPLRRFQDILGVSPVIFAFSRDSEGAHGKDEHFPLEGMGLAMASWTSLYRILGRRG
ncbi:MAG TPA: M20/M25/M40 family metallo-hydrolase [Rectinemataceae bacterium]|nr:M20/M25/M40 family metallo-hydrolase [Rectinemataceae bacterium]